MFPSIFSNMFYVVSCIRVANDMVMRKDFAFRDPIEAQKKYGQLLTSYLSRYHDNVHVNDKSFTINIPYTTINISLINYYAL